MGRSLAYLVSAPPSHYKTCKNIVERLQHRPAAVPADISISDGPPPKVPKFGGAVPLGVLTPRNLDFSLAFLVNALVLDRTVSESALDEAFFGLLRRTAPEAAERALEKLRFRGGSKTPLADPPAELRALIDAELAESGSDASSESSSSDGLSESGSTPRTVLKLPNSEDETALTQNPLTLLNRPSPEQLAQWHLLEHRPSSSDETSTDEPASDSSSELEDDEDTAFAALLENLRMHPPRPLEQSPHQTLQPKAPETLQSNPPETRLTSPETRFSPEPLHPASRLLPVRQLATTPLRAHVAGPYMELGNRILRRRPELTDRFLRVFFTEEDLGHLGNGQRTRFRDCFLSLVLAYCFGFFLRCLLRSKSSLPKGEERDSSWRSDLSLTDRPRKLRRCEENEAASSFLLTIVCGKGSTIWSKDVTVRLNWLSIRVYLPCEYYTPLKGDGLIQQPGVAKGSLQSGCRLGGSCERGPSLVKQLLDRT